MKNNVKNIFVITDSNFNWQSDWQHLRLIMQADYFHWGFRVRWILHEFGLCCSGAKLTI